MDWRSYLITPLQTIIHYLVIYLYLFLQKYSNHILNITENIRIKKN